MELVCDNKAVEKEVAALHDICEDQGAILHNDLRMVVERGNIWLESDLPADNRDVLISLPQSCLPPIDQVSFKLTGNDIEIESIEPGVLSDTQERCLQHMLAIYNATGKIRQHKETSPWFALAKAPDILAHLVSGRKGAPKIEHLCERLLDEGPSDALAIDSFLGTRKYGALGSAVLMPFIDYANHHGQSPGFQSRPDHAPRDHQVSLINSKPRASQRECTVRYGMFDALDTFLTYGFVDGDAEILRSSPVTLDTGKGTIAVEGRIGTQGKKQVPKDLSDLRLFVPQILQSSETEIRVAHLVLPDTVAPLALRRILNWLIRLEIPEIGLMRLRTCVNDLEAELLAANTKYYDELESKLSASEDTVPDETSAILRELIAQQRQELENYTSRLQSKVRAR
jgi:hypothetical protein